MKRSEANKIVKLRVDFSMLYDCFSIGDDEEPGFNHSGCECCQSLACDTYTVKHLLRSDVKNKVFDETYESELCGSCLCSLINGDDSDLDFSVDDENE